MAITTDPGSGRAVQRARGHGIVVAGDRTDDFRRAIRHSRAVRFLRLTLPLASIGVVALYGASVMHTTGWSTAVPEIALPKIVPENLSMANPRYQGFNGDGSSYFVQAKSASQSLKQPNLITLDGIDGDLTQPDKTKTKLVAARGLFDNGAGRLQLFDSIEVASESGLKAQLKSASVAIKDNIVETQEPVVVEMPAGRITANAMTLRSKLKEVTFRDQVRALLNAKTDGNGGAAAPAADLAGRLFGASNQPIDITAERLDIKDGEKRATFTGNVRATQSAATLETPVMLVTYAGQPAGVPMAKADGAAGKVEPSRLQRVVAQGPVVMTQKNGDRLQGDSFDFDAVRETAAVLGNVVMTSAPDRRATADRVDIDQKADTILLTGGVNIAQGRNELKGRRLFMDRKAGRTQLTSPADQGGNGRINARFFQANAGAKPAPAAPVETDAQSGALPLGATAFKTDPNAPIEIEANSLDLNDAAKNAVFRGDVQAVQGDVSMRTTELTAFYSGQAGLADGERDGAARQPSAQLTRIEARRKVVVTSKNGQSATGDWADFDTKANAVTVGGDVVLTQGQNVVRGSKLLIDLTTGQSTIQAAPGAGWAGVARTTGGAAVPVEGGRPSAVFYPKQLKEGKASAGAPASLSTKPPAQAAPPATAEQPRKPNGNNWDWAADAERKWN